MTNLVSTEFPNNGGFSGSGSPSAISQPPSTSRMTREPRGSVTSRVKKSAPSLCRNPLKDTCGIEVEVFEEPKISSGGNSLTTLSPISSSSSSDQSSCWKLPNVSLGVVAGSVLTKSGASKPPPITKSASVWMTLIGGGTNGVPTPAKWFGLPCP